MRDTGGAAAGGATVRDTIVTEGAVFRGGGVTVGSAAGVGAGEAVVRDAGGAVGGAVGGGALGGALRGAEPDDEDGLCGEAVVEPFNVEPEVEGGMVTVGLEGLEEEEPGRAVEVPFTAGPLSLLINRG